MPDVIDLTQDLIRFRSMHSRPDEIQKCIAFIEDYLTRHGVGYRRIEENGIPTLLVLRPDGSVPVLLMSISTWWTPQMNSSNRASKTENSLAAAASTTNTPPPCPWYSPWSSSKSSRPAAGPRPTCLAAF